MANFLSKYTNIRTLRTLSLITVLFLSLFSGILYFLDFENVSIFILKYTLLIFSIPLWFGLFKNIIQRRVGVDLIAGVALAATFLFGAYLPGIVVLIMLSGGETLEDYAFKRARRSLHALLGKAPHIAHIKKGDLLEDVAIETILVNDVVIVKPGETVPVDGVVISGIGEVDESTLTGESVPVSKTRGNMVLSGTVNLDGVLEIQATKKASDSKFEQIIRMVREAENAKAPIVRLADRYSIYFTALTFILALATWFFSHDITRVLAVLVVATPCPLILATPIAIVSGISRAARRGIMVKNGGPLELLAAARTFVFDKTGTITLGAPQVTMVSIYNDNNETEVLSIAASLDQYSAHILAHSLVSYAIKIKKIVLKSPKNFKEYFGDGVVGELSNKKFFFGKLNFLKNQGVHIAESVTQTHLELQEEGIIAVYLSTTETLLGRILFKDTLRTDTKSLFDGLLQDGIKHLVLLTGDRKGVADKIGQAIGITDIRAECLPDDKVREIKTLKITDAPVVMIGDGVNDAPALAIADVGIAIGSQTENASSDSADIVIVAQSIYRVREALAIARVTIRVAKQGIWLGMTLSIICMFFASFGFIIPLIGALIQEAIDVVVIINALRVGHETDKSLRKINLV